MIVQFSTGGRGRDPAARGSSLYLQAGHGLALHGIGQLPDHRLRELARLSSIDLAAKMLDNGVAPEIEIFDLSHLHGARRLVEPGLIERARRMCSS